MICQDFLARYSEFVDGEMDPRRAARMQEHLVDCAACARYDRVVRQGAELVRGLPDVEPAHDFFPRLQHRIYNLEEDLRSRRDASTTGAAVSLAVAGALALLAWAPLLRSALDPAPSPDGVGGPTAVEATIDAKEPVHLAAEAKTPVPGAGAESGAGDLPDGGGLSDGGALPGISGFSSGFPSGGDAGEWSRRAASWLIGAERSVEPLWRDAPARRSAWSGQRRAGQLWPIDGHGQAVPGWSGVGGTGTMLDPPVSTPYRVWILDVPTNGVGSATQRRIGSSLNPE